MRQQILACSCSTVLNIRKIVQIYHILLDIILFSAKPGHLFPVPQDSSITHCLIICIKYLLNINFKVFIWIHSNISILWSRHCFRREKRRHREANLSKVLIMSEFWRHIYIPYGSWVWAFKYYTRLYIFPISHFLQESIFHHSRKWYAFFF